MVRHICALCSFGSDAAANFIRDLALMCKSTVRSAGILAGCRIVPFSHMDRYAVVFGTARGCARKDPRAGQPGQYSHQLLHGFRHHSPPALVSLVITTSAMVLCFSRCHCLGFGSHLCEIVMARGLLSITFLEQQQHFISEFRHLCTAQLRHG